MTTREEVERLLYENGYAPDLLGDSPTQKRLEGIQIRLATGSFMGPGIYHGPHGTFIVGSCSVNGIPQITARSSGSFATGSMMRDS